MVTRRGVLLGGLMLALGACSSGLRHLGLAPAPSRSPSVVPLTPAPTPTPIPTPSPTGPATFVTNGPRTSTGVALTFHASGDLGMAGQMLDLAKAAQAPITVFAVGNWLEAAPAIGNRILAEGHELGNHTYTHPALGSLTAAGVADEIDRCVQVLQSVQGNNGRWFRPSGIDIPTPTILDQVGKAGYFQSIGWDIDPLDYNEPGGPAVVSIVTAGLKPGSIISLHFGYQSSLDAFPQIVSAIRAKGLQPMLLRDLLG